MFISCPSCGSRNVRHSRVQHFGEHILSLLGRDSLRCKDCQHRFLARIWRFTDLRYARCPCCYRTELSTWSEDHYIAKWFTSLMLALGAKRIRCEYCRFNFASFRPVRQVYRFRRNPKVEDSRESSPDEAFPSH
ncbi:MAG: hypothetical protein IANPNBLG_00403 [Bryobacteraceae bacterium]|nr:hypothetical protein [Bryobacteraceae bacterium]